jgi:putative sterol carrier protein
MTQISINTPKELSQMLEGKSDGEILSVSQELGFDTVLEKTFEGMCKAFKADTAKGQSAVIQWDIGAEGAVYQWQVKVAEGACSAQKNGAEKARVTLGVDLPNFLRLITGKLNGQQAFFAGKLKLSGDMMFAMTQESWFDKNWGG